MIVKKININSNTGEVLRETTFECRDVVNEKGVMFRKSYCGTKVFIENISPNIEDRYLGRFFKLIQYMNKDNVLVKRTAYDRNIPLTLKDLEGIFGLGDKQTRNIMKTLQEYNLIRKTKYGYMINPTIVFRSKRISHITYDAYKDLLVNILPGYALMEMERYRENNDNF